MAQRPPPSYLASMSQDARTVAFRIDRPAPDRAEAAARREAAVARIRAATGIDEALIDALVEGFYARVREDALIGPIFAERIEDWGPHLEQMKLFWSSVALSTGVYQGRPMPKHLPLPIDARHFDRWLQIFEAAARDLCPPVAADHFIVRARRVAESLELGVANANGVLVGPGERYRRPMEAWSPDA
ncbi:group III truncated hemoglobin [Brevundimonas faecalis]|uniref:Hemoglobin n=1 Tax=Brevundimonas faecalis TaxID=947378 RepID=A0ABV2RDM0_9CAUL